MKKSVLQFYLLPLLLLCALPSFAQKDTSGMSEEEKRLEMEYQESVATDSDRRVEIPFDILPEDISLDLHSRFENPVMLKAWRWVDEEGNLLGYEVYVEDDLKNVTVRYDKKGKPEKKAKLEKMKKEMDKRED